MNAEKGLPSDELGNNKGTDEPFDCRIQQDDDGVNNLLVNVSANPVNSAGTPSDLKINEFNCLDQAIGYCKRGWSIIPIHEVIKGICTCNSKDCRDPGKHPRVKWKEYQDRVPTEEEICKWWKKWPDSNIGLITGKVSGVIALDIDKKGGGEDTIQEMGLVILDTLTSKTGGGGWHYIFSHPQFDCRNFAGQRGETVLSGIDFRGDGGFIVLPPSMHQSGNRYSWVRESAEIAGAPDWLLKLIREQATGSGGASAADEVRSPLEGFPEGRRDIELYRYACQLRREGRPKAEARLLVHEAAANCDPPFTEQEADKKVESAYKATAEKMKSIGEPPETFTAAELEEMELRPTKWILEGILPEGLTILAGRAKSGKSFLALQLALSTALGEDICGFRQLAKEMPFEELPPGYEQFGDKPRGALYMDLEMDKQSIQSRMEAGLNRLSWVKTSRDKEGKIRFHGYLKSAPKNLHFTMNWRPIGSGFEEDLNDFLDKHPDVELVVVDVIKRVRPLIAGKDRRTSYELDYDTLIPLQSLAKERGIAILVLHHTCKKKGIYIDPVEMVSGTMGTTAAVDSIYVLDRHRDNTATLHITGRKFESQDISLEHGSGGIWKIVSEADKISAARSEVIKLLTKNQKPMKIREIAEALGKRYESAKKLLWLMAKNGLIVKENNTYILKPPEPKPLTQNEMSW